jgi:hypothetical protein
MPGLGGAMTGTGGAGSARATAPTTGSTTVGGAAGAGAPGSQAGSAPMGGAGGMNATGMAGAGAMGPSTGTGGMDAMGSSAGAGGAGQPSQHADLGKGDGRDVITIGDSWMNLIVQGIEPSLDKVSGQTYRHYAAPGTLVLNEQIPNQYESAKMASPDIKTIVMTGGGNDILTSSCADTACNSIVDMVGMRLTALLAEAGKDGVQDVVLIGYTYPSDMTKHESLDYSIMVSTKVCAEDSMPRCHFVDSTKLMITLQDGIHPNPAGDDLVAQTAWDLMQAKGVRR